MKTIYISKHTGQEIDDAVTWVENYADATTVTVNPILKTGTKTAEISVGDETYNLYCNSYSKATTSSAGLMSADDKTKLDGLTAASALSLERSGVRIRLNNNGEQISYVDLGTASAADAGLMSAEDKRKLDADVSADTLSVALNGTRFSLNDADGKEQSGFTFPYATSTDSKSTDGFMSGADKKKLDGIASASTLDLKLSGTRLSLLNGDGNEQSGVTLPYATNSGSTQVDGLMSYTDKGKLDSIISGDDLTLKLTGTRLSLLNDTTEVSGVTLPYATTSSDGLMSQTDKTTLDNVKSTYLPLSGGTMTGDIVLNNATLKSKEITGTLQTKVRIIENVKYSTIDPTHTTRIYFKELLKYICKNYTGLHETMFICGSNPGSAGSTIIWIYDTGDTNDDELPRYAGGVYINVNGRFYGFTSYDYNFTWNISQEFNTASATKLATARTINGVSFDGTSNITIHETDSGWVNCTLGSYAKSGTIQYRTLGNTITVQGTSVVLANDVKVSPNAPQSLATSPLSFANVKQAYGYGRFGSYTAIVRLTYYNNTDSIIEILGDGDEIPSGKTGNFSVTGFID